MCFLFSSQSEAGQFVFLYIVSKHLEHVASENTAEGRELRDYVRYVQIGTHPIVQNQVNLTQREMDYVNEFLVIGWTLPILATQPGEKTKTKQNKKTNIFYFPKKAISPKSFFE